MTTRTDPSHEARNVARERAYVGIDVAFAKRKYLPVCVCVCRDGRLIPLPLKGGPVSPPRGSGNVASLDRTVVRRFARDAARYLRAVADWQQLEIVRIAIDAPRDYRAEDLPRRAADAAMAAAGISCFTTPSRQDFSRIRHKVEVHLNEGGSESRLPHANQLWMLAGFSLFEELGRLAECIEVFPQAIVRAIGAGRVHKSKAAGLRVQIAAGARHTGWSSAEEFESVLEGSGHGPKHDKLDAYLSAWVASLDEDARVAFGVPPHDVIWIPRTDGEQSSLVQGAPPSSRHRESGHRTQNRLDGLESEGMDPTGLSVDDVTGRAVRCPACGDKTFKKWPYGWDAHAAHQCAGLTSRSKSDRRAEFKARFIHLFRPPQLR